MRAELSDLFSSTANDFVVELENYKSFPLDWTVFMFM